MAAACEEPLLQTFERTPTGSPFSPPFTPPSPAAFVFGVPAATYVPERRWHGHLLACCGAFTALRVSSSAENVSS